MVRSTAATVEDYLDALPPARRADVAAARALVRANLPEGYVEAMRWGMITWEVPLAASGPTYNRQPLMYVALGAQKRHIALYLCGLTCVEGLEEELRAAYAAAGRRLDLGKACLRFGSAADIEGEAVARVIRAVPPDMLVEASRRAHARSGA
jgi:uncharacterized protein YdhG (YjbR/CyaY superfamily)